MEKKKQDMKMWNYISSMTTTVLKNHTNHQLTSQREWFRENTLKTSLCLSDNTIDDFPLSFLLFVLVQQPGYSKGTKSY